MSGICFETQPALHAFAGAGVGVGVGGRVVWEIRSAVLKPGDGYNQIYYSFLEVCSPIKTGGRRPRSLCLSGSISS